MKTIYIAGPMRGYPRFNFEAFHAAERYLEPNFNVFNPARMDEEDGFDPDTDVASANALMGKFFDRDIEAIKKSDAIVLLPWWEKSTGATAEMWIAKWLGKEVLLYPSMTPPGDEDVLEEALRITTGDRNNSYGPPDQDFARTAKIWEAILHTKVRAKDIALCMIAIKLSRATWANKRDNWTDIAGYARCGFLCEQAENGNK